MYFSCDKLGRPVKCVISLICLLFLCCCSIIAEGEVPLSGVFFWQAANAGAVVVDSSGRVALSFPLVCQGGVSSNGLIALKSNDGWAYYTEDGMRHTEYYQHASMFIDERAIVKWRGNYFVLDKNKKMVPLEGFDFVSPFSEGLARVSKEGLFGYIDTDGRQVISCKYKHIEFGKLKHKAVAGHFQDGFAAVGQNEETFFINKRGSRLPGEYAPRGPFSCGLAPVEINKEYSFIDKEGKAVLGGFTYCESFSNGLAYVEYPNGIRAFISPDGNAVFELDEDIEKLSGFSNGFTLGKRKSTGKYLFLNRRGESSFGREFLYATPFRWGFAYVTIAPSEHIIIDVAGSATSRGAVNESYSLQRRFAGDNPYVIDSARRIPKFQVFTMMPTTYSLDAFENSRRIEASPSMLMSGFSEGLALCESMQGQRTVLEGDEEITYDCVAYCNRSGRIEIDAGFIDARTFSEGLAAVRDHKSLLWGYIDKKGNYRIFPQFNNASQFRNGLAVVGKVHEAEAAPESGMYSIINIRGEVIFCAKQDEVIHESGSPLWPVTRKNNLVRTQKTHPDGSKTRTKRYTPDVYFVNARGEHVDLFGRKCVSATGFFEGLGFIRFLDQCYSLVTLRGAILQRSKYIRIKRYSEGHCVVVVNGENKWQIINSVGQSVSKNRFGDVRQFRNGIAAAKQDKFWGVIGYDGEWIVRPKFSNIIY